MKRVTSMLLLLLLSLSAYSQDVSRVEQKSDTVKIFFDLASYVVNSDIEQNQKSLQDLTDIIQEINSDTLSVIIKIEVDSYTSPEGGRTYNMELSRKRSDNIYRYLTDSVGVDDSLITVQHSGIAWRHLADMIESSDIPNRDKLALYARHYPEEAWVKGYESDRWTTLMDSRLKALQDFGGGEAYRYMAKHFFPLLRRGEVVRIYYKKRVVKPIILPKKEDESEPIIPEVKRERECKLLFAIKTNLLFDIALMPNIELEIPIGKRFSVAGEWIFPWWISDNGSESSSRCRLQLLNGNIEGKYWLGDRTAKDILTGWYVGLYAGGGLYDFEYKKKGYQGEFFIASGVSGGYAHTINRSGSLRMEYSLGVGYMKTNYRYYESVWGADDRWHPVREKNGTYSWLGPTRARVSLVWLIRNNIKRGGSLC